MDIGQLIPKIQTFDGFNKQKETKEMTGFEFYHLYLKNSICDVDQITSSDYN